MPTVKRDNYGHSVQVEVAK